MVRIVAGKIGYQDVGPASITGTFAGSLLMATAFEVMLTNKRQNACDQADVKQHDGLIWPKSAFRAFCSAAPGGSRY
jgi:hypothetical protein